MSWALTIAICGTLLFTGSAFAGTVVEDRAAARVWLDRAFAGNDCRFTQSALNRAMIAGGVAPGVDDMAQPLIGTTKIIRQRLIMAELEHLFATGAVCEDPENPTIAISKFGGCA